jgi:hypothetical protein
MVNGGYPQYCTLIRSVLSCGAGGLEQLGYRWCSRFEDFLSAMLQYSFGI